MLDSGSASYERLTWTEKGDGLAVLKGNDDRRLRDKLYAVVGFTGFAAGAPTEDDLRPGGRQELPRRA